MRISMIVWLLCCVMQAKAFTAIESYQNQLKGVKKGDVLIVKDEKFLNNAFDWTKIHNKAVSNIITFGLFQDAGVVLTKAFKCQADLKIEYWSQPDQVDPVIVDHVMLDIGYDPQKGVSYQASATYRFMNGHRVKITVNDITSAELGSDLPAAFQLTGQIAVERWYDLDTDKKVVPKVVIVPATTAASQVALSWDKITGAEEYDLEWTFIDEESDNGRLLTTAGTGVTIPVLTKMFRNNATRVTLQQEYYNISLVHFSKYLLLRARTVMYNEDGRRIQGAWNYDIEQGTGTVPAVITLNNEWHLPAFNWQYSAVYAEEGKKKEIVSYFDGTLRTRQTVTVNNSDQKAVVQESIYDEFGRPLASLLPAPLPESDLKYYPGLHLTTAGTNYNFNNVYGSGSNCINVPEPLGTAGLPDDNDADSDDEAGGAGQYYSPLSKFLNTAPENKYIPNAGGYPFAVTRYTPDNTGRVSVQGGVGATFQPGNKATRYYYGKPEQWELDRLFGNDVGFASHYLKNMVVDGNGQISVSYQDASGKTIATALAGKPPLNTDALASKTEVKSETFPVLQPGQFSFDPSKLKLSASTTYMVAVPDIVSLAYDVEQLVKIYTASGVTICSNCYYELYIKVTDNCNRTIFNTAAPIPVGSLTSDCSKTAAFTGSIDVDFNQVGEYYISFELGLTQEALTAYTEDYVARNTSLSTQYSFVSAALFEINSLSCFDDCSTCKESLGTKVYYTSRVKERLAKQGVDVVANESALTTWSDAMYDMLYNRCLSLRTSCISSPCQELENTIRKDVSPGGQYALFGADNVPLEKNINVLYLHWREVFPIKGSTDPDYISQQFELGNGLTISPYDEVFTLDLLVKYWNADWAAKFESFHPEYCALRFCRDNSTYLQWDQKVKTAVEVITDIPSVIPGAIYSKSTLSWLVDKDPFFIKYPDQRPAFIADLTNYSSNIAGVTNPNLVVKHLVGYVDYMLYCSDYTGTTNSQNTPAIDADNWTNCSPVEDCRIADMEWQLYRDKYLELKQKYFQIVRNTSAYCGSTSICAIGAPLSFSVKDCPGATDFIIQADPQSCATCVQPVRIVYVGATALTKPVTVKIYYPAEYSGIATTKSVSFIAGQKEASISVDHTIPVNSMRIAGASCAVDFCEQNAKSSAFSVTPLHLNSSTMRYTISYNGAAIPAGGSITAYMDFTNPESSGLPSTYFVFNSTIRSQDYDLPLLNTEYTYTFTSFSCFVPSSSNPPASSSCDEAYQYKISRINSISYQTPAVPTDIVALKAIADAQFAAQLSANCEAQADNWMQQLTECLSSVTQTKKDQIRAKLIAVCKLGADINHPNGASTTAGGVLTADGYNSFGQVIKGELNIGAFTMTCNPWLLDAPYPYDTKAQAVTNIIQRTNAEICARLTALTAEYNTPGGNLYLYLKGKYGAAMNLTADEFAILQKGCVNCRYLLAKDVQLPVFLDGNAKGCVSPSEFNAGVTALQQAIQLSSTDPNYESIYATYLNQRWGFTLSYTEYKAYVDYLAANAGTAVMLCNQPVYAAVKQDPYSCLMEQIDDAVSRGTVLYKEYIAEIRRNFRKDYIAYCGGVKAKMNITAKQQLYHYTLYYYDQAGNLVRTVPPEGVRLLDASLFATVDAVRNQSEVTCTYDDEVVDKDKPTALQKLTTILQSTTNSAMEMWLYNSATTSSQVLATTGNNQYLLNTCVDGNYLHLDTYTLVPSADGKTVDVTLSTHTTANLQAVLPLKQWTHIVVQGVGLNRNNLAVYVNGKICPLVTNAPNSSCGWEITSTATGIVYPENLSTLKHLRLYNRLLSAAEIAANAGMPCLSLSSTALNDNLQYWGRFNIPEVDGGTTVGDGTTTETQFSPVYPAHSLTTSYAYHSLNGIRLQHTPDGGNNQFYYDRLGRLFASHNDAQWNGDYKRFSYTTYDEQGRVNEVGETLYASLPGDDPFYEPDKVSYFLQYGVREQITRTYYDEPYSGLSLPQENLRKRVSAVTYQDANGSTPQQATYYSYDQIGNVKTLWQQIEGLGTKKIDYQYDLVSGKVNKVGYQRYDADKFYYGYQYDAENRLTKAYTGTDLLAGNDWEVSNAKTDAAYRYYLHGPLARTELGNTELVQ